MTIKVTYNVTDVYVTQDVSPVYINVSYSSGGGSGAAVWGGITGTLSDQTDLQSALDGKFDEPTGDTTQYIAGDGSLVAFPITGQAGTLVREVRNVTGATLTKGTVVYINGASGNKPTVAKAIATSDATSAQTFGLIQADIPNNSNGYLVAFGDLDGLDTSAFADGVQLYLSSTVLGGYTSTKQYAPAHLVYIGVVTRSHPNQGRIEVRIQNGYEMDELHDVAAQNPNNNDGLFYNTTTSLWENKQISTVLGYAPEQPLTFNSPLSRSVNAVSIPQATGSVNGFLSSTDWTTFNNKQNALGYTPANAATTLTINGVTFDLSANRTFSVGSVTGSGASGQVAYWTGTSAQSGSNNLFWDAANSRLGIGTNAPQATFSVKTSSSTTKYIEFSQAGGINYIESIDRTSGQIAPLVLYAGQGTAYIGFVAGSSPAEGMRLTANRNLLLQNGGTFTDSGERLQVTGNTRLNGSTDIYASSQHLELRQTSSTSTDTTDIYLYNAGGTQSTILFTQNNRTPLNNMRAGHLNINSSGAGGLSICSTTTGSFIDLITDGFTVAAASKLALRAYDGNIGVGTTPTAALDVKASTTTAAAMRLRSGTAPTSPNDGDIWFDGTDIKMRIGGVTKTFTLV